MAAEESRRRSRWMFRVLEWDDPRARYPNLWHEGMPIRILAHDTVGTRLRLGDLVAVYHPASQKHPDRAERFVGISRVTALRRAETAGFVWVDVETAHRFADPLDLGESPRRVFLCCDPGWPECEVDLFRRVFAEAERQGWRPAALEREGPVGEAAPGPGAAPPGEATPAPADDATGEAETAAGNPGAEQPPSTAEIDPEAEEQPVEAAGTPAPAAGTAAPAGAKPAGSRRRFAGASYSGDMRDDRSGTWLAVVELAGEQLQLLRLEGMARSNFQAALRDADAMLLQAEAIGLDFPFGLPQPFAEALLGGAFPEEGWWALAKRLDRMSRPDYLVAVQEFAEAHGELKRYTDEASGGESPLRRTGPDRGPQAYHGIRLIAEERSRYAVRPFETAQGRLLLEVSPSRVRQRLAASLGKTGNAGLAAIARALEDLDRLPVRMGAALRKRCTARAAAMDAVFAARCAADAVLSGEAGRPAADLAPGAGEQVRREGWIYGLGPAA